MAPKPSSPNVTYQLNKTEFLRTGIIGSLANIHKSGFPPLFEPGPVFRRSDTGVASLGLPLNHQDGQSITQLLTAYDGHLYAKAAVNGADVSFNVGSDGEQRAGISRDEESGKSFAEQLGSTHSVLPGQQRLAIDGRFKVKGNLDVSNSS